MVLNDAKFDFHLILVNEPFNQAVPFLNRIVSVSRNPACFAFHVGKLEAEQADGVASSAPLHAISERHILHVRFDANRLCAVYAEVDAL